MGLAVKNIHKDLNGKEGLIDLSRFPPNLRKLGKHLLKKGLNGSMKQTCEDLGLKYHSIASQIYQEKIKGNDFNKFINEIRFSILDSAVLDVDNALIEGAVSGKQGHIKLFYELKGDLKDDPTNITVNVLSVSAPIATAPIDLTREKGIVDLEPLMPDTEDEFT